MRGDRVAVDAQLREVDGASIWRTYRSVTLPLLRPALLVATVLNVIYVFNSFPIVWTLNDRNPGFGFDTTREQVAQSRIARSVADVRLRQQMATTLADVRRAYWELVYAADALQTSRRSLELAERQVEDPNRIVDRRHPQHVPARLDVPVHVERAPLERVQDAAMPLERVEQRACPAARRLRAAQVTHGCRCLGTRLLPEHVVGELTAPVLLDRAHAHGRQLHERIARQLAHARLGHAEHLGELRIGLALLQDELDDRPLLSGELVKGGHEQGEL